MIKSEPRPERDVLLEYVDRMGLVELHEESGYYEKIDLYSYLTEDEELARNGGYLEKNFTRKCKSTGIQQYFHCIPCCSRQMSVVSLTVHLKGAAHAKKSKQLLRKDLGFPPDPPLPPQPKAKKLKKEEDPQAASARSATIRVPLSELLQKRADGDAALGLQFIHEYLNPRRSSDPRMYTCRLTGCKSAWGSSNDMLMHLVGSKQLHNRNYLVHELGIERAQMMLSNELSLFCKNLDDPLDRDYGMIVRHVDDVEGYEELRERPMNWSEKKAKAMEARQQATVTRRRDVKDANVAVARHLRLVEEHLEPAHLKSAFWCLTVLHEVSGDDRDLLLMLDRTNDLLAKVRARLASSIKSDAVKLRGEVEDLGRKKLSGMEDANRSYRLARDDPDEVGESVAALKVKVEDVQRKDGEFRESFFSFGSPPSPPPSENPILVRLKGDFFLLEKRFAELKPLQLALWSVAVETKRSIEELLQPYLVNKEEPERVRMASPEELGEVAGKLLRTVLRKDFEKYKVEGRKAGTIVWKGTKEEGIAKFIESSMGCRTPLIYL